MRKIYILAIMLVIISVTLTSGGFYLYQAIYAPNFNTRGGSTSFYIYRGDDFDAVRNRLFNQKIMDDAPSFSLLAKWMKYTDNVKPGHYIIKERTSNLDLIRMLRSGNQQPVNITFSNVRLLNELPAKICANIELDSNEYLSYLSADALPAKYGFNEFNFSTMFIPNTYQVYWTITAEQLTDRMYQEFNRFWNEERKQKAENLGLTPVQVSILASIVEAETRHYDESPVIAGLYINRLRKGMLLQADPTLKFAVGDFSIQRVLKVHMEVESPYNTYKYVGLPPGPINFPSIKALDAVLNFNKHNYIYMCAKEDFSGYHNFASSLSVHNANARRYQNALNKAKLYK